MTPALSLSISGAFQKGEVMNIEKFGASSVTSDATGGNVARGTKTLVSNTEYTIPLQNVATIGCVYIKNNGESGEVITWGAVTAQLPNSAGAGQHGVSPSWNGSAVIVKCASGTPKIEWAIFEA